MIGSLNAYPGNKLYRYVDEKQQALDYGAVVNGLYRKIIRFNWRIKVTLQVYVG